MSWLWTLIFLTFTLSSEAKHHAHKLPPAAASVVGTVYCDTCFHQDLPKPDHFIAGATVAVECKKSSTSTPHFRKEVKTDSRGEFRVELPFSVGKHVKTIRGCSVALVRSSDPTCAAAAAATSSSLRLKSRSGKEQIFSAGLFTFRPQLCNQKQKSVSSEKFFFLPPNPLNPGLLPPNPLLPPPALIPPVLPTPPPSLIPPVLPTPPSPPSFPVPLPPIPGLAPPPSPPAQPTLPVPLPPLPMPLPPLPTPLPPLPTPLPPLPTPLPPLPMPLPPLPTPLPPLPLPPVPVLPVPPVIPGGPPAKASSPVRTTQP